MWTLFFALPAVAATWADADVTDVLGWTADGAVVIELARHELYEPEEVADPSSLEPGTVRHVVVLRGDEVRHDWVVGSSVPEFAAPRAPASQEAEWVAWRAAHPIARAVRARTGSAGVSLALRVDPWPGDDAPDQVDCTDQGCSIGAGRDDEQETWVRVGLTSTDGFWPLLRHRVGAPMWTGWLETSVTAWWSADGRRVIVVVDQPTAPTMRGPSFGTATVTVAPAAPLISVLAHASLGSGAADAAARALAGLGAVQTGEAQAPREASVVYAKAGFEEVARQIAARVPGGAAVEPMTWDGPQHVVVGLGASAR
jgi:hypothetical protein